ncbi:hypothetical protein [Nonomuraea sp. NPDC049400]|uniref:hypothetical protein n=1 Tax=Nonomuraea sp. NPDC049400 TaxID=3364352 RepID=UPI0037AC70AD
MTTDQQPRERLTARMETRRVALRLQWGEVATRAGMSTAHLRRIRNGESPLTPLMQSALEDALQWARGSIGAILEGGDPVEVAVATGVSSLAATGHAKVESGRSEDQTTEGLEAALRELARRLSPDRVRAVLEEVAPTPKGSDMPAGERRYEDDADQHLWETPGLDERERRYLIHQLESLRRFDAATDRSHVERPSADVREFRRRG